MTKTQRFLKAFFDTAGPISVVIFLLGVFLCLIVVAIFGADWIFDFLTPAGEGVLKIIFCAIFGITVFGAVTFLLILALIAKSTCSNCSGVGMMLWGAEDTEGVCPKCEGSGVRPDWWV